MKKLTNHEVFELPNHNASKHIFLANKPIFSDQAFNLRKLYKAVGKPSKLAYRTLQDRGLEPYLMILPLALLLLLVA